MYNQIIDQVSQVVNLLQLKIKALRTLNFIKFTDDVLWGDFDSFKSVIKARLGEISLSQGYVKAVEGMS